MRDEGVASVLQRMVGVERPGPALSAMTPAKAMRLALARAGDEALGCVVGLQDLGQAQGMPEALMADLPDPALLMQLNGTSGVHALAVLCPQVVAAVIEAQTMGRVVSMPAANRTPTRTDAIMLAEFLDMLLAGYGALMADAGMASLAGLTTAGPLADVRAGTMILEDAEHQHMKVELDFARGAKVGVMHLVIPLAQRDGAASNDHRDWSDKMHQAVLASTTRLEAILCRQKMPLARVAALRAGDVIRLDTASLDRVSLAGTDGVGLITTSLGRSGAMRALRVMLVAPGHSTPPQIAEPQPES